MGNVAGRVDEPARRRSVARRPVDRSRHELGRRRLRAPHDRRLAAVAAQPALRLRRRGRVPRPHVEAVRDRCVPVGDDRRHPRVLPARLADRTGAPAAAARARRSGPGWARDSAHGRGRGAPRSVARRRPRRRTLVELAIPLRHLAYAGDVRWTEEGYYGSFRDAHGEDRFARLPGHRSGDREIWTMEPGAVLTSWQANQAAARADLTLAACNPRSEHFERRGIDDVEVRVPGLVRVVQRAPPPADDRPGRRPCCARPARPGGGVRASARAARA